ncbi:ABC transporter substrate-binding protein [Nonomuraea guangzhouensis]|uniref:ABC transporter substrate-binding protein n=1 Tax=Nonomuraea guangzhouensis TaxID=1291555 RepID=A0ABW4FYI2_9ACTN|nr:ABC transporter substrate-binding protein [Nonomuraea guangzhouensis]
MKTTACLLLAVAMLVTGCGGGTASDSGGPATRGGSLTILRAADIDGWDPDKAIQLATFQTLPQVMEGLVRPSADGNSIQPALAEKWKLDAKAKTITFTLRPGLAFSDGRPLTSEDAAFSVGLWRKGLSMGSLYAAITGTATPDDRTLVIKMKKASTFTLTWLSNGSSVIVPKDFGGMSRKDFFAKPIGAGPFVVGSYQPGQRLVLERNRRYYDPARPKLDHLTYEVVADPNQQMLRYQSRQADAIEAVPLDLAGQIPEGERVLVHPSATIHGIFVNAAKQPGNDIHFRRAVSLAIDRGRYTQAVFGGLAAPATGGLPPGVQGSVGCGCTYETGVEKAKAELAKSSYQPGTKVELVVDATTPSSTRAGETAAAQLRAIGIDVDLQKLEVQVLVDRQAKGAYDLSLGEVGSVSPTVGDIFGLIVATGGLYSGLPMKTISDAFDRLEVAQTDQERAAAVRIAETWIHDNLPYIPTAFPDRLFAVSPKVKGLHITPFLSYPADLLQAA